MPEETDTHSCVCPKNLTVLLLTYFLNLVQQLSPRFNALRYFVCRSCKQSTDTMQCPQDRLFSDEQLTTKRPKSHLYICLVLNAFLPGSQFDSLSWVRCQRLWWGLTNREELSFLMVLALPKASRMGLACSSWFSSSPCDNRPKSQFPTPCSSSLPHPIFTHTHTHLQWHTHTAFSHPQPQRSAYVLWKPPGNYVPLSVKRLLLR